MSETIFAAFVDPYRAENAAGALLDHGVPARDISLVLSADYESKRGTVDDPELGYVQQTISAGAAGHTGRFDPLGNDLRNSGEVQVVGGDLGPRTEAPGSDLNGSANDYPSAAAPSLSVAPSSGYSGARAEVEVQPSNGHKMVPVAHGTAETPFMANVETGLPSYDAEKAAKYGVTTTTPEDAAAGAAKGAGIGLGVGALAALAAVAIPGVGLVIGGGALAMAVAGMAATTGAGAIAGGAFGFMKDQGVPLHHIPKYQQVFDDGGAILGVSLNSSVPRAEVEEILQKYGAHLVDRYGYVA